MKKFFINICKLFTYLKSMWWTHVLAWGTNISLLVYIIYILVLSCNILYAEVANNENTITSSNTNEVSTDINTQKMEEKLPVKPFTDEYEGIAEFKKNKVFMFSDIQKLIAAGVALFFFAVCISELTPLVAAVFDRIVDILMKIKSAI